MANIRRIILILVLVFIVGAVIFYLMQPRPEAVDIGVVERGNIESRISEDGQTRVKEAYMVSAPISGRLRRINLDVGDDVVSGETIIAEIQPADPTFLDARSQAEAEAQLRASEAATSLAEAGLERAEADVTFARSELDRTRRLQRDGHVSQARLEEAQLSLSVSEAARGEARALLAARQAEEDMSSARLIEPESSDNMDMGSDIECCINLHSPTDGQVLAIYNESETTIQGGENLLEIGDATDLEIVADLLSSDAVQLKTGADVRISGWGGDHDLVGHISRIEPAGFTKFSALGVEEQRVNVIIAIDSEAAMREGLGHGYRVIVHILVDAVEDVLMVPLAAVFRDGENRAVFVNNNGVADIRHVVIGLQNNEMAELVSGLEIGEEVILYPSDRISAGVMIEQRIVE